MEGSLFNLQQMVNDSNSESGSSYSSRTSNKSESQIVEPDKIGQDDSNESYNKEKSSYTKSENQTSKRTSNINEMSNYKNTIIQKHDILQLKVGTILSDKKNVSKIIKHIFKKIMDINKINQSYNEILKEINNTNQKFFDEQFPPNENTLIKGYNIIKIPKGLNLNIEKTNLQKRFREIKWERESEILNYERIFGEQIEVTEIKPGEFSNSNFISVISALAEFPNRIEKIFISRTKNKNGIFSVNICKDGLLREIVIDDYFPFFKNNNSLCFSSCNKNLLWVQILEKCYAKAYGSYNNIDNKHVEGILRDLTYAPVITLDNSNDDLIQALIEAFNNHWLILASAGDTEASQELLKELGLKENYEYAILFVYTLTPEEINSGSSNLANTPYNDENYKTIIKIRNLWSTIGWIGDWSDYSSFWTPEFKERLQYENGSNCFFMNLKDFKHYFSKIKICKYMEDYKYTSIQIYQQPEKYSLVLMKVTNAIEIHEPIQCCISFIQEDKRDSITKEYIYGISRMIISRIVGENLYNVEYIEGKIGQEREICLEKELLPGEYLIFCELSKIKENTPYVISCYSNEKVELIEIDSKLYPKILEKIFISCAKIQNLMLRFDQDGAPNCRKYSGSTIEGYSYIYVENLEEDAKLIEDVKYTKFEGLQLLPPFHGTSYHIEVGPGQSQLILIKHIEVNEYNLIFSYQSSIQFGEKTLKKLAKEKGNKKKRKDTKENKDLDIDVYIYKHTFGLCYYYENNTKNKRLKEQINIATNTNVDFVGEKEGTNEIIFVVEPGETHFVELRGKNNLWKVQPKITYAIETLNDGKENEDKNENDDKKNENENKNDNNEDNKDDNNEKEEIKDKDNEDNDKKEEENSNRSEKNLKKKQSKKIISEKSLME